MDGGADNAASGGKQRALQSLAGMPAGGAPSAAPAAGGAHPLRAFLVLFFVEIWERFGYYGMASIMVLYMVGAWGGGTRGRTPSGGRFRRWSTPCR
jgi:hypothetical protein